MLGVTKPVTLKVASFVCGEQTFNKKPMCGAEATATIRRSEFGMTEGLKIGDVDPRDDASACFLVSDKSLAIGGAVLEAILTRKDIREKLWE